MILTLIGTRWAGAAIIINNKEQSKRARLLLTEQEYTSRHSLESILRGLVWKNMWRNVGQVPPCNRFSIFNFQIFDIEPLVHSGCRTCEFLGAGICTKTIYHDTIIEESIPYHICKRILLIEIGVSIITGILERHL